MLETRSGKTLFVDLNEAESLIFQINKKEMLIGAKRGCRIGVKVQAKNFGNVIMQGFIISTSP